MSSFENRVQKDLVTDAVFTESNEEFILPDYMPEIGRVLRVCATLLPEEHYAGSDSTEFSGRIEYRLLYGDGEGNITEAPLEGRYRYRLSCGKDVAVTYTEERIESVSARPSAPRKLGIRTRILAKPHLLTEEEAGLSLTALVGNESADFVQEDLSVLERDAFFSGAMHSEERFCIEDASPDAITLISAEGDVLPELREAHDGYVSVRGKLIFTLLLKKGDALPFVKTCVIPFEEEVRAEGARTGDAVSLHAFLGAPSVTFEENGENTDLLLDAEYSLSGVLFRNRPLSVLKDLYVHGARHEITRKPFSAEELVGCAMGNLTVGGDVSLPSDFTCDGCLLPHFSLKDASASHLGEKAVVEGSLAVSLLCFGVSGVEKCEAVLPFRVELPMGHSTAEGESIAFSVTPVGGSAQASGEGVRLSTELSVSICSTRTVACALPSAAVKLGEIALEGAPSVTLYYPTDGDTLWSVGKRYGIPLSVLKEQNGMGEEEDASVPLDGYSYLFVNGL